MQAEHSVESAKHLNRYYKTYKEKNADFIQPHAIIFIKKIISSRAVI
jgi:hypothetical protein